MRLLLDEMYSDRLRDALRLRHIDAISVAELRMLGAPDDRVFEAAQSLGYPLLTENVGDFTRLASERIAAGGHHAGVLIALSSRFSRRPGGIGPLVASVHAVQGEQLDDRVVYLQVDR